jgi:NADPH-dependent glutamate synthase beta subunit-like oxidoreductase
MIKLGLKDQLLKSPTIWHCTHCDTCLFVCPQSVRFSSVVDVLRSMAVEQGYCEGKTVERFGTAPCKATCPAHISIPGFIGAIAEGRHEEGLRLIKEEMPFPGICGRVCPHPCEEKCNRGKIDKPVAIEYLKRFLADMDLTRDDVYVPERKDNKKERVAVIGAGPTGLSAACYLAIKGYQVTVFEKLPVAGGMMAVGIPEFRLPRDILQGEIDIIRRLGVEIRLGIEVGKDITFEAIQKEYDAVYMGIGCQQSLTLGIQGEEEFTGVMDGLTFLREINLGNIPGSRGKLIIIGGGNTAVDCARVAKRIGYENVTMVYRRTRDEMPASPWEVEDTIEEDIDVRYLTAPMKVLGENGKLSGVECIRMKLGEPDESGRQRPVPVEGSEFEIETDVVVTALGQKPELSCFQNGSGPDISSRGLIIADPQTCETNIPGVFSGGDVVSGPRTVVEAVASGKEAAVSIDRYLRKEDLRKDRERNWKGIEYTKEGTETRERESIPRISISERMETFKEIDRGFSEDQARCEAGRCLRLCGMQKI